MILSTRPVTGARIWTQQLGPLGPRTLAGSISRAATLARSNSGNERFRRTPHRGEDVRKAVPLVVGDARLVERARAPNRQDDRRKTTGDHQSDCERLRPQAPQITEQLHIERAHAFTNEFGCSLSALIPLGSRDPTVGKEQNPIRNVLDAGIVSDHKGSGPELAVDGKQRLDDADARPGIQGTGRLIAQKHFRLLGNGAGDGHTLLLAARELRREMVHSGLVPDQRERVLRTHRPLGYLRHQGHVFSGCKARDQVVELEHEAHVAPAVGREPAVVEAGQLQIAKSRRPLVA
jgi:hypothetical protein